jgi:hypothetical protein
MLLVALVFAVSMAVEAQAAEGNNGRFSDFSPCQLA